MTTTQEIICDNATRLQLTRWANTQPAIFFEQGLNTMLTFKDEPWMGELYDQAFAKAPVQGYQHGRHIVNRPWAGPLFCKYANTPGGAVGAIAYFEQLAFVGGRPQKATVDDALLATDLRAQTIKAIAKSRDEINECFDPSRKQQALDELNAIDIDAKVAGCVAAQKAINAKNPTIYPWAKTMIRTAAGVAPDVAECDTYKKSWSSIDQDLTDSVNHAIKVACQATYRTVNQPPEQRTTTLHALAARRNAQGTVAAILTGNGDDGVGNASRLPLAR